MSIVLVGMSYRCAPVSLLERATVSAEDRPKVAADLLTEPFISEALIVSTCNRTEFYVVCEGFHPTVEHIVDTISRYSGASVSELFPHLYVRYAESAVEHMLRVAAGLASMVVGEQQIIGQIRDAYASATEDGTIGHGLHELAHRALRTGKRVHAETDIDDEGPSMVSFAVRQALDAMGVDNLDGRHALVVGAGAMASLASTHLGRLGASMTIANRTLGRAQNVASHAREVGVSADATDLSDLVTEMSRADIVVTATGALDPLVDTPMVDQALAARAEQHHGASSETSADLVICDLSLPRDVVCAPRPGVTVLNIDTMQKERRAALEDQSDVVKHNQGLPESAQPSAVSDDAAALARSIVAEELRSYVERIRSQDVVPTVKALRRRGAEILRSELDRIDSRTPDLSEKERKEVHSAMKRVVDKLMHTPTVQLKKLAGHTDMTYSDAIRDLFGLDDVEYPSAAEGRPEPSVPQPDSSLTNYAVPMALPDPADPRGMGAIMGLRHDGSDVKKGHS